MDDRLARIEARVAALEWAFSQLPIVLSSESGIPYKAIPEWLHTTAEAALRHNEITRPVHDALTALADGMLEIPPDYPEFLKQLRRDGL